MASRRSFLLGAGAGAVAGAVGMHLGGQAWRATYQHPDRPPWAMEHSTGSFWLDDADWWTAPPRPPLNARTHRADLLIVGGGFTGLSTAWHLRQLQPDARITLIDGARCGFGASGRNGGWCMGANYNAGIMAPELAGPAREFMAAGVDIVRGLQDETGIDCDFTPASQLYAVRTPEDRTLVDGQAMLMEGVGVTVDRLDAATLAERYRTDHFAAGAVFRDGSANIQPARLALGLRKRVIDSGVEIFEGTKVMDLDHSGAPRLTTEYGTVEAERVVLATNAYTRTYGEFSDRYVPVITNVIATAPLTSTQLDAIGFGRGEQLSVGDSGDGYFYAIVTADDRIVIGGGHAVHHYGNALHSGNIKTETNFLEDYLTTRIWPQLEGLEVTHRWGGNVCVTRDLLFSFGRHPRSEDVFYALGYTGEGVSTSFACGKALAQMLSGEESELTRSPFANRELGGFPGEPLLSPLVRMMA